jgi:hypothetical protein
VPATGAEEALAIEINVPRRDRLAALIAGFTRGIRDAVDTVGLMMEGDTDKRFRSDKPQIHNARDS